MATHSRILAWRIPWTEEPAGPSPWGHKELDTTEQLSLSLTASSPLLFLFLNFWWNSHLWKSIDNGIHVTNFLASWVCLPTALRFPTGLFWLSQLHLPQTPTHSSPSAPSHSQMAEEGWKGQSPARQEEETQFRTPAQLLQR